MVVDTAARCLYGKTLPADRAEQFGMVNHLTAPGEALNRALELDDRSKRSLELNLKSPSARPVLERLVRWADVCVTSKPAKCVSGPTSPKPVTSA